MIGWDLGRTLATSLPLRALEKAILHRRPQPGLVHHSDRGTQYASNEYVKRLETCGAQISMSRVESPWGNGKCESFIKTLKREEVEARQYRGFEQLQQHLEEFIGRLWRGTSIHCWPVSIHPLSNRACGFPAHGLPMIFLVWLAPGISRYPRSRCRPIP